MASGIGGGGLPRVKEFLVHLKSLADTVVAAGAGKAGKVNLRDILGNELGTAAGLPLKVDVSGDFPDNIQGAVEKGNADIDPLTPGHLVKPVKTGGHANVAAPVAVAENQIADAWYDLNGRLHVAMDDGSLATLGAITDAMAAAGDVGTVSAKLRRVSSDVNGIGVLLASLEALGEAGGPGIKQDIVGILGTSPTTAGKLDTKVADGDDVALGAIADDLVEAGDPGTISAKLRRLSYDFDMLMADFSALQILGVDTGSGIRENIVSILGTAPTTAGKFDVKVADGDDVVLGSVNDDATTEGGVGSISAKLRCVTFNLDLILTAIESCQAEVTDPVWLSHVMMVGLNKEGLPATALADAAGNLRVAPKTPPTAYAGTGAGAIAVNANPSGDYYFHSLLIHFSAAPVTSENIVVTLNPVEGATYNTTLYKVDPSVGSLTDVVFQTDAPLLCRSGDTITVAYPNTDARTYGARVIVSPA
jgi:hypothetical protein